MRTISHLLRSAQLLSDGLKDNEFLSRLTHSDDPNSPPPLDNKGQVVNKMGEFLSDFIAVHGALFNKTSTTSHTEFNARLTYILASFKNLSSPRMNTTSKNDPTRATKTNKNSTSSVSDVLVMKVFAINIFASINAGKKENQKGKLRTVEEGRGDGSGSGTGGRNTELVWAQSLTFGFASTVVTIIEER